MMNIRHMTQGGNGQEFTQDGNPAENFIIMNIIGSTSITPPAATPTRKVNWEM